MPTDLHRALRARVPGAPPWWVALAAVALLVLVALDVAHHGALTHLDTAISTRVKDRHIPAHGPLARAAHVLILFGQRAVVLVVSAAVVGVLVRRAGTVEPALRWLLALVLMTALVYAFKLGIERAAPSYVPGKPNPGDSFPSGHLANAILIWSVLAWAVVRFAAAAWMRTALRVAQWVAPPAVFVGMTLLDYHWFSDFVGGACIGLMLLPVVLHPALGVPSRWIDRRVRLGRPARV